MVLVGVVSWSLIEVILIEIDARESANWSLFGAERWSLSEVSFY